MGGELFLTVAMWWEICFACRRSRVQPLAFQSSARNIPHWNSEEPLPVSVKNTELYGSFSKSQDLETDVQAWEAVIFCKIYDDGNVNMPAFTVLNEM